MTTDPGIHDVIAALGKTGEHSLTSEAAEGSTALVFTNSGTTIDDGDQVFTSDLAATNIQYRGIASDSDGSGISVSIAAQETLAINAVVWKPTAFAYFPWRWAVGGLSDEKDYGIATAVSRGSEVYKTKVQDTHQFIDLLLRPMEVDKGVAFRTFLEDSIEEGLSPFSLGWYDDNALDSRVDKVVIMTDGNLLKKINLVTASLVLKLFLHTADSYVDP